MKKDPNDLKPCCVNGACEGMHTGAARWLWHPAHIGLTQAGVAKRFHVWTKITFGFILILVGCVLATGWPAWLNDVIRMFLSTIFSTYGAVPLLDKTAKVLALE